LGRFSFAGQRALLALLSNHDASILFGMTGSLADAWAKFERAKLHADVLQTKIIAWIEGRPALQH
jgi:hypothetical protein